MKKLSLFFVIFSVFFLVGCSDSDRDVSISLPTGTYYGPMHVTINCVDPTAQITYSLDGSDPATSDLIYDKDTGLTITYTSDLKATAGGNVAQAHYDIIPYTSEKDAAQMDFYLRSQGTYSTSVDAKDNFIFKNSTVTFQQDGQPEVQSEYILKDVNGNTANLIYTDGEGNNKTIALVYDPDNYTMTVDGKTYTALWYLEQQDYYQ